MTDADYVETPRTRLKRKPGRASYDREVVHAILDEALVCHLGFNDDMGPVVIPTIHCRIGDNLYVHGSAASHVLKTAGKGIDICVTVSLIDGLVLARSAFHHSMNYRSVMIFGAGTLVEDVSKKSQLLDRFVEQVVPGRSEQLRPHTESEIASVKVVEVPLETVSAKVRAGGVSDEEGDMDAQVWAGVLPVSLVPGEPETDPAGTLDRPPPTYVTEYRRP